MEQTSTATSAKIKTYYRVKYKEGASGTIGGTMTKKPSIWVSCSYLGKVSTGRKRLRKGVIGCGAFFGVGRSGRVGDTG